MMDIFYPLYCGGCGAPGDALCPDCTALFRYVDAATSCPLCGREIGKRVVCGECMKDGRGFLEGHYGFHYEGALRNAMHSFKFNGRKDTGRRLVALLEEKVRSFSDAFDLIVPVPVTGKRLKERGFNQSFIIADEISRITGKEIAHSVLVKTKETADQYTLSREERKKNIRGVFAVKDKSRIQDKRILLVDDLFTTGYTAREAAKVLAKAQPAEIRFFALARTPS